MAVNGSVYSQRPFSPPAQRPPPPVFSHGLEQFQHMRHSGECLMFTLFQQDLLETSCRTYLLWWSRLLLEGQWKGQILDFSWF